MLGWLLNLGFAGGGATATKGGWEGTEFENWRSKKHKDMMKGLLRDDEEIAALILLQMIRGR